MSLTRADVDAAADRIRGRVRRTPVLAPSSAPDAEDPVGAAVGAGVGFKLEMLQHTGCFKARGAFNRILAAQELGLLDPGVGVVVASGGNAGLATAFAARSLDTVATVFLPTTAPAAKVARLREYGADVRLHGTEFAAAQEAATAHALRTGALTSHAYDLPEIVAGAGTIGLELLEQAAFDTVVIAVGGGGLMAGVATALAGRARVVAVEPESAPTLHRALEAGRPVDARVSGVAADSLGARRLGDLGFAAAVEIGVTSVLVTDAEILDARRRLWSDLRLVVETGAATAYAALLSGGYRPVPGERVVVVLCGANTDPSDL